ncbi:MAG TPA: signal peptidase I [Bacillota bacterium]|nr:signal peptidase I [Bacillota bacterium]
MKLTGRVWRFGDDVDTDLIIPARYLNTSDPKELAAHCMEDADPSFAGKVQPGDIITYRSETGRNFITHRVARINSEGALLFYTMGDANEALDPLPAQARQLVGKVALSVPYLGYLLFFFRTRAGLMLLCCLAVLFIAGELIRTILLREKKGLHSAGEEVAELRINRF